MGKTAFIYVSGLGINCPGLAIFDIQTAGDVLELNWVELGFFGKSKVLRTYEINFEDILSLENKKIDTDQDMSVALGGVVGGMVGGDRGAMIGAMNAVGKKVQVNVLVIKYLPSTANQHRTLVFSTEYGTWSGRNATQVLKLVLHMKKIPKSPRALAYLGVPTELQEGEKVKL